MCMLTCAVRYLVLISVAYSALIDITLAILPWTVIWNLQMRRAEKIGVSLAMSMGILCVANYAYP